ncbi:hypothetical protein GCM10025869_28580 [Homoserinibacter gongjuensis]|uniref:Uncharacterized protein n=1 Tax=Homoserinibacter gongjuensis TaxID=1162968 RepID=A0ABQ6JYY7_9MICO|nr:hypothetical protein GCM10025869_28580 [Homoserinibacter gongjuensis]
MPLRILTVSGSGPAACTAASTMPRNRSSFQEAPLPALAGDLRHRAAEVEVDVVGAILGHEHRDGFAHRGGVDAVELDGARRLGLVMLDEAHRLGVRSTSARLVIISET